MPTLSYVCETSGEFVTNATEPKVAEKCAAESIYQDIGLAGISTSGVRVHVTSGLLYGDRRAESEDFLNGDMLNHARSPRSGSVNNHEQVVILGAK